MVPISGARPVGHQLRKMRPNPSRVPSRPNAQFILLLALLFALLPAQAMGQTVTCILRGRVIDSLHALEGAELSLFFGTRGDATATTVSDRLGHFEFDGLAANQEYRLQVVHRGYVTVEAARLSLASGETKELRITMDPQKALANAVVEVVPSGEREEVRALPVRGQASGNLETLIPGSGATGGTIGSFPVNGSRAQFNT